MHNCTVLNFEFSKIAAKMIKFVLNNYYNWIKKFLHLIYNFIEGMSQL